MREQQGDLIAHSCLAMHVGFFSLFFSLQPAFLSFDGRIPVLAQVIYECVQLIIIIAGTSV